MKPSPVNYLLSHLFWLSTGGGTLIAIIMVTRLYIKLGLYNLDAKDILYAVLLYVPAGLLGFILGFFPGWMIIGNIVSHIKGAPFEKGDTVCVLSGKHKGTITTVYEVWESIGQVKVDLGPEAKDSVSDVFCNVAVFKMEKAEYRASGDRSGPRVS